jgi:hypothetical protein
MRSMSRFPLVSGVLAALLVAGACTSGSDEPAASDPTDLGRDQIQLTSGLGTLDSCDALLDRLKADALDRVGPYGFNGGGAPFGTVDFALEEAEASMDDSADAGDRSTAQAELAAGSGEGEFSETNNQEASVDEADLVKTDGQRLVVASGNRLEIIDVTGSTPRLVNTVQLPDEVWGGELFLSGNRAVLMTSGYTPEPFLRGAADLAWFPGSSTGRVMEIDLEAGTIERTLEFEGSYLSAREIDGTIRIVVSASEQRFNFVFPSSQGAEDTAEAANRGLIESSTIEMWLPTYRVIDGGPGGEVVTDGPIVECGDVHLPAEFAGFGSLVVLTADIDDGLTVTDSLSVFTDGRTVYASPDRLAVATPRWPEYDEEGNIKEGTDDYRTAIHHFDISDPANTSYTASGTVRGHLLNQYSLSESNGFLRVATTDGTPWDSRNSESYVTVLAEEGGQLVQVGQVGGLGVGEQIFAVRFLGDLAYVVTFEQIDPLYTVDLTDPANPVVRGELKIPGVSDYLHPWGDGYLVAVGRDGDDQGLTGGVVATLFDVRDANNPTQVTKLPLSPTGDGSFDWFDSFSPVQSDARAFTPWQDVAIIPVAWYGGIERANAYEENNGQAVVLVRVDTEAGTLTPIGRVGHPVAGECESETGLTELGGDGQIVVDVGDLQTVSTASASSSPAGAAEEPASDATDTNSGTEDAEASLVEPAEEEPADDIAEEILPGPDGFCYRYQPEIRRSVVIGDNLYTISEAGVAVNNFDSLDAVTWIPFELR